MEWKPGDRLRHATKPEFGPGEVLSVEGGKLHIRFVNGGPRVFVATAPLERLTGPAAAFQFEPTTTSVQQKKPGHSKERAELARERFRASPGTVEVRSAKSQRADIWGPCSVCGRHQRPLWHFADSSAGPLYFCVPCKDGLYDDADGGRDVLDLSPKVVRSGAFEMKRQRH